MISPSCPYKIDLKTSNLHIVYNTDMKEETEEPAIYSAKVEALAARARQVVSKHPEIDFMDAFHILENLDLTPAERLGRMLKRHGILRITRS